MNTEKDMPVKKNEQPIIYTEMKHYTSFFWWFGILMSGMLIVTAGVWIYSLVCYVLWGTPIPPDIEKLNNAIRVLFN